MSGKKPSFASNWHPSAFENLIFVTFQLISFIDVFLRKTNGRTVLAIVPVNTLQNWLAEFNMWMPNGADPRLKDVPEGAVLPRQFNVYSVNDNHKNNTARAKVVGKYYSM